MSSAVDTVTDACFGRRRRASSPESAPDLPELRRERCPRCSSLDTKFCYYNNYNTSQPRHFCKSCRRYWTLGGSLRNVPVGGSSRKRLRPSAASATTTTSAMPTPPAPQPFEVGLGPLPLGFPLGLGDALLDGRAGFDLGLGLGIGPGPLLWSTSLLEEDVVAGDTWRMESGGDYFGAAAAAVWKDMGFSGTVDGGAGGVGVSERKVH